MRKALTRCLDGHDGSWEIELRMFFEGGAVLEEVESRDEGSAE